MDNKAIGQRIKSIRINLGMTTEDFAKIFKASKGTVSKWENGYYIPNNERLKKIAEEGEVSINYLLYGSTWEFAKNKINDICEKYKITDTYLYMVFENYSSPLKGVLTKNQNPKEALIDYFLNSYGGGAKDTFQLSYEMISSPKFEEAFLKEIQFTPVTQNLSIEDKIEQYLNEIIETEYGVFNNQKYKPFFKVETKEEVIQYISSRYKFDGLTDYDIKHLTKELAERYLDKLALFKNYTPFSDSNAANLASDLLSGHFKLFIIEYFQRENLTAEELELPVKETIKDELSYETYNKIMDIIDNASDKLKELK